MPKLVCEASDELPAGDDSCVARLPAALLASQVEKLWEEMGSKGLHGVWINLRCELGHAMAGRLCESTRRGR